MHGRVVYIGGRVSVYTWHSVYLLTSKTTVGVLCRGVLWYCQPITPVVGKKAHIKYMHMSKHMVYEC